MAFCRNCGNQLRPGVYFCPACGTVVNNSASRDEELSSSSPKVGVKKKKKKRRFLKVFLLILVFMISFLGTRVCTPNLHCKLFSWFPFFESPSMVAYHIFNSLKEGNIDETISYMVTSEYQSRSLMKENMSSIKYNNDFRRRYDITHQKAKDFKEFNILSEKIYGSHAIVEIEFVKYGGSKETDQINLYKDADGAWAIPASFD